MRTSGRAGLATAVALIISGCAPDVSIEIRSGSTAEALVFDLADPARGGPARVRAFSVWLCDNLADEPAMELYWRVTADGREPVGLDSIEYGVVPVGFSAEGPARRLEEAHCYLADPGRGGVYFEVLDDGSVTDLPGP